MGFFVWHYSDGLNLYLRRWYFLLAWVIHFFSIPVLFRTIFSPWKRLIDSEETPGFSFERFFRQLTFNLISRGIGAVVRIFLLIFGLLTLVPAFLVGLIGLIAWIVFPLIGIPYYLTGDKNHLRSYENMYRRLSSGLAGTDPIKTVFDSHPGKFVLSKLEMDLSALSALSHKDSWRFSEFSHSKFEAFVEHLISSGVWSEEELRESGLDFDDLRFSARWWDTVNSVRSDDQDDSFHLSQPGLGLELLFGYTPLLNQFSIDLSKPQDFSHHLIGREDLVNRIERELTGGSNVFLIGQPGVGRRTVTLEFARRAMSGELGADLLYKRCLEFDYNFLLSESLDINQKKAKLSEILSEAAGAGNIVLVIRDIHRLVHPDIEGLDFTDLFEKFLEKRHLKIIALLSSNDYERFVLPNSRLRKFFQVVEVQPVSKSDALLILFEFASRWEAVRHISISVYTLRAVLDGADNYITDTPFPEKALELLDHVIVYMGKNRRTRSDPKDVNVVISEETGISVSRLTEDEKNLLTHLEEVLHRNLIGQDIAVHLIAQSLRARTVGTKSPNRPVGSFLFLGPTGVGKTQTAKTLSRAYYGSEKYLLRFDMAEYSGSEGVSRLIGSVSANRPGNLTSAIRKQPASLLLLDEIEKSSHEIYNLFLTLLDEGQITDAFGKNISCRHLFVIATSNAGSQRVRELLAKGVSPEVLQKEVVEYIQTQGIFSPEFLNRFDGVVVFQPLEQEELKAIAKLMLQEVAQNLVQKNVTLEITDDVCLKLAQEGYQPDNGARAMRRIVDLEIGDIIGKALLSGALKSGDHFRLVPGQSVSEYQIETIS
jgi:ATP-dependent Clp protease ATP-binding subunit ClpC